MEITVLYLQISRHQLSIIWKNFIRIGITVLYLKSCRCQLWIWRTNFLAQKFEKCIYFVIYLYVFKLVCTRWENFIRIGKTVLYLKSWSCQYPFYWLRFASPVKLHLRPSNPQLTPPTLQIQYCYSLITPCMLNR